MEDLGAKFGRDRTFCFDRIVIHEIIFDESNDVTLFCTVPYYSQLYTANIGVNFDQLNTLLRSTRDADKLIASALAEKLNGEMEIPSVIEIGAVYGAPLDIHNCIIYTTLYDVTESEDAEDGDESEETEELGESDESMEEAEGYAFLVDDIRPKDWFDN